MAKELKNKPLVEAILEIRWALQKSEHGWDTDPYYKILLGRLYDRIIKEYPADEQLQTANIPEEILGRAVLHRFRVNHNSWPLIQIGPGVMTLNSTADYSWSDFYTRAADAVSILYDAYPKPSELFITNLILRYIDAVEFNYTEHNAFQYIRKYLKVNFELPPNLFESGIESRPDTFSLHTSHKCSNPAGMVTMRFASGNRDDSPAIVWETIMESAGKDIPKMPDSFKDWIRSAHVITSGWFFKLIEGDLEGRFSGE
ncbi:MAG: hypothetical protein CVT49_14715 [candidate division Zixibacteria bacterium HGW-Zixibacteria-1]|nr:MAG: hypothetical protein CVT49_14715 [candidate division Zixibacteria bacterium HGW-Zixibacteria-1]